MASVFGPRIGSLDVEQAVIAVLTERLPTYLDLMAGRRGIDVAATGFPVRPRQPPFARKDFGGWPDTRLPCVQVVSPGQSERPYRADGDGLFTTTWQVNVFIVVTARDHAATRLVRSVYEDATGMCLMQDRSLTSEAHPDGFASAMDWLGESSADVTVDEKDNRTLQGTVIVLSIEVPDTLDPLAGPAVFIPDPGVSQPTYPDDPLAEEVTVTLTPEEMAP